MFLFSVLLMAYGFIALFKKEWIWKLRSFSARLEGRDNFKRDEEHTAKINHMGNMMAIAALILGFIAFVMNIATVWIMLNPNQSV
jgi:hypothetical protein